MYFLKHFLTIVTYSKDHSQNIILIHSRTRFVHFIFNLFPSILSWFLAYFIRSNFTNDTIFFLFEDVSLCIVSKSFPSKRILFPSNKFIYPHFFSQQLTFLFLKFCFFFQLFLFITFIFFSLFYFPL